MSTLIVPLTLSRQLKVWRLQIISLSILRLAFYWFFSIFYFESEFYRKQMLPKHIFFSFNLFFFLFHVVNSQSFISTRLALKLLSFYFISLYSLTFFLFFSFFHSYSLSFLLSFIITLCHSYSLSFFLSFIFSFFLFFSLSFFHMNQNWIRTRAEIKKK